MEVVSTTVDLTVLFKRAPNSLPVGQALHQELHARGKNAAAWLPQGVKALHDQVSVNQRVVTPTLWLNVGMLMLLYSVMDINTAGSALVRLRHTHRFFSSIFEFDPARSHLNRVVLLCSHA